MSSLVFPASAFDHLSAPAVVCGGRKTSFRDLLAHSARLAREFRKRLPRVDAEKQGRAEAEARAEQQQQDGEAAEAAEGPRIAIFGRPGTDYVAAMWAAWAAGGVAVPLPAAQFLAPLAAEAAAAFVPSDPLEGKELEERDADEEKAGIEALKNVPFSHAGGCCGVLWGAVGCCGVLWGGCCGVLWGAVVCCGVLRGAVGCCGVLWVPWGAVGCCEHSAFASYMLASDPLEGKKLEERNADEEKAGIEALKNVPFSHADGVRYDSVGCRGVLCGAVLVYTSGTTGRPKGVVHSHIGLASQAGMLVDAWDFSPSDRVLNVLPLHHIRPHAPFHPLFLLPHRLHCPCPFSTCLILLYPFSTCVAAAPYPPTRTFPSPLSPATHRLHCPCPFSTCLILLYPFSTCAASAPYPPTRTFPSPLSPAAPPPLPLPFLHLSHTPLSLLYLCCRCTISTHPHFPLLLSPCHAPPPLPFPLHLTTRSSLSPAIASAQQPCGSGGGREGGVHALSSFLPSHRFSAAAVWQRWRESYPDGSAVVITRPPSLPLPLSRPVLPSFSGRVPPIPLPRKSRAPPKPPLQRSTHVAAVEGERGACVTASLLSTASHPCSLPSQAEFLPSHRFSAAAVWQRWRESYPDGSSSPTIASAQQQCGSAGGREGRMCRCITALHPLAHPFTPLSPITFRSSSSPTTASAQQPCGSGGEKATPMVAAPSRNLFTAPSLTSLSSRRSSFSPATTSAQQPCGSGGERATPMGAHATSPPLPTSSHLFPLALTPSIAPHAPTQVEFLPNHRFSAAAVWQRWRESYPDGRCAQPDSITFFTGVEFFPSHRFSAAAVWQRWRESYPDGRCAQPDSITFFTGVPTHYMRLLQEFDRMPLQLQRKSALAASKLRLMMSGSAACPDELMRHGVAKAAAATLQHSFPSPFLPYHQMSGSAACPDELMRRWHQVTGQRLLERYGMTE
ncbi:unnamed protein product, partial [Closterium sp. NIES-64]